MMRRYALVQINEVIRRDTQRGVRDSGRAVARPYNIALLKN